MTILRDARFGLRLLGRSPGFTAVAVITLALGISATTAIFSVVYGTFLAPLPYRDADALVMVWSQFRGDRVPVAARDFLEWKRQATSFSDLNAWGLADVVRRDGRRPRERPGRHCHARFPRDAGLRPPAGARPHVS